MTNIICWAQPNGFWPISKLVSIAMNLTKDEKLFFFGSGISLEYVTKHKKYFAWIYNTDKCWYDFDKHVANIGGAIIVMDHTLAHVCYTKSIKYLFIDSLFWFWNYKSTDEQLFLKIRKMQNSLDKEEVFNAFTVHEKKIIAHVLADHSYVQSFIWLQTRKKLFEKYFPQKMTFVDAIIDRDNTSPDTSQKKLIFNLGGVKNFLYKDSKKNDYMLLVEKLVLMLAKDNQCNLDEIHICSWFYKKKKVKSYNWVKIIYAFYKKEEFSQLLYDSYIYITSPWLTNFFELIQSNKKMLFFLEQHMSQYYNLQNIKTTFLKPFCLSIHDMYTDISIPQDDFIGSEVIRKLIQEINNKNTLTDKVYVLLCKKIQKILKYKKILWNKEIKALKESFTTHKNVFNEIVSYFKKDQK